MTPDEINCEIAEWMGWQSYRIPNKPSEGPRKYRCLFLPAIHEIERSPAWLIKANGTESICNMAYIHREGLVPDYYHNLNVIHEAEKSLVDHTGYWQQLQILTGPLKFSLVHATAPQRCKALLRTIGKWKE